MPMIINISISSVSTDGTPSSRGAGGAGSPIGLLIALTKAA